MLKRFFLFLSFVAVMLNLNCRCEKVGERIAERMAEKAIEKRSGEKAKVDIEKEGGKITIEGEEGKTKISVGEGADLSGLPPEIIYPGAVASGVVRTENEEQKAVSVYFKTKDDLSTIENHYSNTLKAHGFTQKTRWDATQDKARIVTLLLEKENKKATVVIKKEEGTAETEISVVFAEEKQ